MTEWPTAWRTVSPNGSAALHGSLLRALTCLYFAEGADSWLFAVWPDGREERIPRDTVRAWAGRGSE